MFIHISGFQSITSVLLDKLYQGSRNFSVQTLWFPWHKMKLTINWLFYPYRSNQHRSWTVFHNHFSHWWTVILSNWRNEKKTHNTTTKNKVHIVYFFKLVICPVVRVFALESLIWLHKYISSGVDCVVSWGTRRSLHGLGFHRIEDHGVTLLTVASWRGDLVSIKYISSFLWISEIYIAHKKQESGELFHMKSWLFCFHSQIFQ
jgi:hypothetical protein